MIDTVERAEQLETDIDHELYRRAERRELARADVLVGDDAEVLG